ncbi:MAG TPA: YicC family protein [Phycisphaerae bacterium]|nr:YicC family protein [Phycisphaerae bacterium]HNU46504.1 YicC family protein [Phycisphaerae bacterium]
MILSMTGYGAAEHTDAGSIFVAEVRSVNQRYLKLAIRLPEWLSFAEQTVEQMLRARLARGSISFTLRVRGDAVGAAAVDRTAIQAYVDQLSQTRVPDHIRATLDLGVIAGLPGVGEATAPDEEGRQRLLGIIQDVTRRALEALLQMRQAEGAALSADLMVSCGAIRGHLAAVQEAAPRVIQEYHARLQTRVAALLQERNFTLEADALAREVALYAERCDISEELTRLLSHLDQFAELCRGDQQAGRTLDFLTQELLRESNTITAKSNDLLIIRRMLDVKVLIDRLREQVQNVE